ncbi:hypothetical protein [Paenibacillus turpanensis]|nr:hypothetical protein [Paenibacillus turpanensis]
MLSWLVEENGGVRTVIGQKRDGAGGVLGMQQDMAAVGAGLD